MNNWQHASVYPAFVLAAALDWTAMVVPLPAGLQQVGKHHFFLSNVGRAENVKVHAGFFAVTLDAPSSPARSRCIDNVLRGGAGVCILLWGHPDGPQEAFGAADTSSSITSDVLFCRRRSHSPFSSRAS